eukprot:321919_1
MLTLFLSICVFVDQFKGNTFHDIPKVIYITGGAETATYSKNILQSNPEWELFYEPNITPYLSSMYPTLNLSTMSIVEQADLWRYSIVNEYGGVYLDNDVVVIKPINEWITSNIYDLGEVIDLDMGLDMIIGIEMPHQNGNNIINPMQFVQWTFVSKANNPILQYVIEFVIESIRNIGFISTDNDVEHDMLIQEKTGPIIWTKAILYFIQKYDITNSMKSIDEINKFGQLLRLNYNGSILKLVILPRSAFCNINNEPGSLRRVLIEHQFHGSWKIAPSATKISDSTDSTDSSESLESSDEGFIYSVKTAADVMVMKESIDHDEVYITGYWQGYDIGDKHSFPLNQVSTKVNYIPIAFINPTNNTIWKFMDSFQYSQDEIRQWIGDINMRETGQKILLSICDSPDFHWYPHVNIDEFAKS